MAYESHRRGQTQCTSTRRLLLHMDVQIICLTPGGQNLKLPLLCIIFVNSLDNVSNFVTQQHRVSRKLVESNSFVQQWGSPFSNPMFLCISELSYQCFLNLCSAFALLSALILLDLSEAVIVMCIVVVLLILQQYPIHRTTALSLSTNFVDSIHFLAWVVSISHWFNLSTPMKCHAMLPAEARPMCQNLFCGPSERLTLQTPSLIESILVSCVILWKERMTQLRNTAPSTLGWFGLVKIAYCFPRKANPVVLILPVVQEQRPSCCTSLLSVIADIMRSNMVVLLSSI